MIGVEVGVAEGVDELPWLISGHLGHHQGEQRVRGDVERHAEEGVGAPLVELAGELAVCHVELEEGVTGGQRHLGNVGHVPGAHDQPAESGLRRISSSTWLIWSMCPPFGEGHERH